LGPSSDGSLGGRLHAMPSAEAIKEAERVMTICNACRYCEGFCAVFPAMELRRVFSEADLKYLANLCHNCRGCYYACQYAPPHEFMLNVPRTLAELRKETYGEFARPRFLARLLERNGWSVGWITAGSLALVLGLAFGLRSRDVLTGVHSGQGAFYRVIPYEFMVFPFLILAGWSLLSLVWAMVSFWRGTGGRPSQLWSLTAHIRAAMDALFLTYLGGGGHGCNYPGERFSQMRRWFHQLVLYGFGLCALSTAVAASCEHVLGWEAPYPLWSWPVLLGSLGGVGLVTGTVGLLCLKLRMDKAPADEKGLGMDVSFLVLLLLTGLSGMALLLLRHTGAMGSLLAVHLGLVLAFFLSLPCSKFVHALYRYGALVRNAWERMRERA
jgi:citrate/tricarballylate utilization protein